MKDVLVKGSGDLTDTQEFFNFVADKTLQNRVVVICGGGTKISAALKEAGFAIKFDDLGRRVTATPHEKIIMRDVLASETKNLQKKFHRWNVIVVPPILYLGSILCPINGDDMVKAHELGFDEIYVLTKKERIEKKQLIFKDFPKVQIISI
jgi:hypothetical protein